MLESDARWELYQMNTEQIAILLDGAEGEYLDAVDILHDSVVGDHPEDNSEEAYKQVIIAHDLVYKLRNILASLQSLSAEPGAQKA